MSSPALPVRDPLRVVRRHVDRGAYREAEAALADLGEPQRQQPEAKLLAAMAAWRLGQYARSRATALDARDAYRALGDVDGAMRAENVAAAGAFAEGDLPEAERGFSRAMRLADAAGNDLMVGRCANNLGNVAYYRGELAKALSLYRLAAASFERAGFIKGTAEAALNTAIVTLEARQHDRAEDAADRAIAAAERAGDQRVLGQALGARSEASAAAGDLMLARAQAEGALALAVAQDDALGEADALRILSAIHRELGNPEEAEGTGRRALDIASLLAHPWTVAETQRELANLYVRTERTADARGAYVAAAEAFEQLGARTRAHAMRERAAMFE